MVSAISPLIPQSSPYRLANLANLALGHAISPSWAHPPAKPLMADSPSLLSRALQTPAGVYTARQLVASTTTLLDVVLAHLDRDPAGSPSDAQSILIDGLAASLSTTGRESVLPLSPSPRDTARGEIADQARRIANLIVKYVRESVNPARLSAALNREPLRIRSPCEGHLWTPAAAALLLGPRSDAKLMELYNEWLHRMILLRDSLLPFENFEEVPLVVPDGSTRGLREVEEPRKLFLVHCLTGAIQHAAIVDLAKVFTASTLPRGGYGFQFRQGLVLPAFLSGSKSLHLLRYHPARFYQGEEEVLFDYEHNEYVDAPRTELTPAESPSPPLGRWDFASLLAAADPRVSESELAIDEVGDSLRRVVRLRLTLESGICVSVDLGQIARGRRYAYEIQPNLSPDDSPSTIVASTPSPGSPSAFIHSTVDILARPGLVISPRAKDGQEHAIHIIPTMDPVLRLALLGKLYPENVILLRENDNVQALQKVGKGFADRFVILDTTPRQVSV